MGQPQPGEVLGGRYRVESVLGRGGMGTVWQATDQVLDRAVAVKVVDSVAIADAGTRARFRREALAVASLTHPRIAAVYDYSETESSAFLVMELLRGDTLTDRLERDGAIPPAEAAEIAAGIAEALDDAHRAGILHRDVKPGNIMLTGHGVKVLDFGIATSPSGVAGRGHRGQDTYLSLTGPHQLIGTPAYLAPERVNGEPAAEAGDLYALGVVLYEMLAGRLPFTAKHAVGQLAAHTTQTPPPLPPDVPPALADVCLALLAKDPAARPSPASAVAARLRQALVAPAAAARTVVNAVPPGPAPGPSRGGTRVMPEPPPAPRNRRPLLLALGAIVAVVLVAAFLWPSGSGGSSPKPVAVKTHTVKHPKVEPTFSLPSGSQSAFEALQRLIQLGQTTQQIGDGMAANIQRSLAQVRSRLGNGHPADARRRLEDLANRIADRSDGNDISGPQAASLATAVRGLAQLIPQ